MKQELISIINGLFPEYSVFLQGSLNPNDPYPDSFFTFWNDESDGVMHYDNDARACVWAFTVYFYSNDPELVNTVLLQLRAELRRNGWFVPTFGYDVMTDVITHTGRALDVLYEQTISQEAQNGNQ